MKRSNVRRGRRKKKKNNYNSYLIKGRGGGEREWKN